MLGKRIITAVCGIPLLFVVIWFDEPIPWFTLFACIWGILAVYEFYKITSISRILPITLFGIIWTVLFLVKPHIHTDIYFPMIVISMVILPLMYLLLYQRFKIVFSTWAWTIAGIVYVGLLLSYLVDLRLEAGRNWVFLAILVTFASDSMAYFMGRAFGKHLLAPRISPKKTWEGAIAGVIAAAAISLIFTAPWSLQLPLDYWQAILLGVMISIAGQFGDLLESLFKRYFGVKESGNLMPGHGGLLDRMDSIVFAGVVVYLYYIFAVS